MILPGRWKLRNRLGLRHHHRHHHRQRHRHGLRLQLRRCAAKRCRSPSEKRSPSGSRARRLRVRLPPNEESINDLLIKALAVALTRVPTANASYSENGIVRYGRIDIGVAVSVEEGLITPVVRNVDRKSIGQIARETRDLIDRAKQRKLKP